MCQDTVATTSTHQVLTPRRQPGSHPARCSGDEVPARPAAWGPPEGAGESPRIIIGAGVSDPDPPSSTSSRGPTTSIMVPGVRLPLTGSRSKNPGRLLRGGRNPDGEADIIPLAGGEIDADAIWAESAASGWVLSPKLLCGQRRRLLRGRF